MILTGIICFIFGMAVGIFYKNRFTIEIIQVVSDRTIKEQTELDRMGPQEAFMIGSPDHLARISNERNK